MAYTNSDVELLRQLETYRIGRGATTLRSVNGTLLRSTELANEYRARREELEKLYRAYERLQKRHKDISWRADMWRENWFTYGSMPKRVTSEVDELKTQMDEIMQRINVLTGALDAAW